MKEKIHLFYLGSYSHLIVADGIIKEKKLPLDKVLFVTYRGVKLPDIYSDNLLFDESTIDNRMKFFLKNFFKLNGIVKRKSICGYFPFQQEFPVIKFFDEYVFFEEGLSAYDQIMNFKFKREKFLKPLLLQYALAPFLSRNMRGLLNGHQNGSPFPFDFTLIGLTNSSYHNFQIAGCRHETIHFTNKPLKSSLIKKSVIIVMDSTHAKDRMESVDNYLKILSDVLKNYDFESRKVYLKLHPDNFRDMDVAISLIKKYVNFIDFEVINESLEDIALSNQNNVFIGNHSTILFYAPIYGDTNKSISFVRINAERDAIYTKWIKRWGGVDGSIKLFSQQMECI